jgi:hypothetical protein
MTSSTHDDETASSVLSLRDKVLLVFSVCLACFPLGRGLSRITDSNWTEVTVLEVMVEMGIPLLIAVCVGYVAVKNWG